MFTRRLLDDSSIMMCAAYHFLRLLLPLLQWIWFRSFTVFFSITCLDYHHLDTFFRLAVTLHPAHPTTTVIALLHSRRLLLRHLLHHLLLSPPLLSHHLLLLSRQHLILGRFHTTNLMNMPLVHCMLVNSTSR